MQMLTCFKPVETIKQLQNHVTEIACYLPAWKELCNQTHCPPGQQRPQQADASSAGGSKGSGAAGLDHWDAQLLSGSRAPSAGVGAPGQQPQHPQLAKLSRRRPRSRALAYGCVFPHDFHPGLFGED